MFYYILTEQIHNVQYFSNYNYEYKVHHLNICINNHQNAVKVNALSYKEISNEIYLNIRLQFLQYEQKSKSTINNIYNKFILTALLTSVNVVLNVLTYIKSIMLTNNKIQNLSNAVVLNYKCVMMCNCNSQLHNFRNIDSILMIKNAVF